MLELRSSSPSSSLSAADVVGIVTELLLNAVCYAGSHGGCCRSAVLGGDAQPQLCSGRSLVFLHEHQSLRPARLRVSAQQLSADSVAYVCVKLQGGGEAAAPADRLGGGTGRATRAAQRKASAPEDDAAAGEVSSEPKRRRGRSRKQVALVDTGPLRHLVCLLSSKVARLHAI